MKTKLNLDCAKGFTRTLIKNFGVSKTREILVLMKNQSFKNVDTHTLIVTSLEVLDGAKPGSKK